MSEKSWKWFFMQFQRYSLGLIMLIGFFLMLSISGKLGVNLETMAAILSPILVLVMQFYFRTSGNSTTETLPKANALPTIVGTGGKVQGIGPAPTSAAGCGPSTTSTVDDWGYELDDAQVPEADGAVDQAIDQIYADLKADGVKPTTAAVAARVVSWLGAHSGELTKTDEKELLAWGIQNAQYAYVATTGLQKAPSTYAEVADYNKWWRENQAACKAPKGEARAVLMTLRDLLKRAGK